MCGNMLNYETAKKLKEFGFPFRELKGRKCLPEGDEYIDFNPTGDSAVGPQHFYIPTLSELIEACGDEFGSLNFLNFDRWMAFGKSNFLASKDLKENPVGYPGDTPEEAVALLWLALQEKK